MAELATIIFPRVLDVLKVEEEAGGDSRLATIRQEIGQGSNEWPKYSLINGHLMHQGRLVLPQGSSLIPSLLYDYHNNVVGGHSGLVRTYKRLASDVYWMGMKNDIKRFVEECPIC